MRDLHFIDMGKYSYGLGLYNPILGEISKNL